MGQDNSGVGRPGTGAFGDQKMGTGSGMSGAGGSGVGGSLGDSLSGGGSGNPLSASGTATGSKPGSGTGQQATMDAEGEGSSTHPSVTGGLGDALGMVQEHVDSLMDRGASAVGQASERLGAIASKTSEHGTIAARAGGVAQGTADMLDTAARYLRDNDAQALQDDLLRLVERRPLQSLLVAVAAGWVVGKVLR